MSSIVVDCVIMYYSTAMASNIDICAQSVIIVVEQYLVTL